MTVAQGLALSLKAKRFRWLADPSRLASLEALRGREWTTSELVVTTGLSRPNASAHLSRLRDRGLVERKPRGRFVVCRLRDDGVVCLPAHGEEVPADVAANVVACTRSDASAVLSEALR